jgi:DNA polymerase-2
MIRHAEGILFDTAYLEPEIHLWVRCATGELVNLQVPFAPLFYLAGPRASVEGAASRLKDSEVAQPAGWTQRVEFWTGEPVPVLGVRALKPQATVGLVRRLLHQDHRLRAYDVDIDPALSFHSRHGLFPLARIALSWVDSPAGRCLRFIRALDDPWDPEYVAPEFRTMRWSLMQSERIPLGAGNALRVETAEGAEKIDGRGGELAVRRLNDLVAETDPDVIVSLRGDQFIMPWLLETAAAAKIPLELDRQAPPVVRRIRHEGRAIHVYSGLIFKAPDYPLFGRWHLDVGNSFFASKAGIEGIVEMARVSRLPVQRQARTSGGTAITAMEIHLALQRRILVPFVKDQVEGFRTAAELLAADKGGLTFYPPVGLWEGVVELDYHQMYPSIMAVHNVSPETMNCRCCQGQHPVPGTSHHSCTRRRGLVPDALHGLLTKRLKYKALLKTCSPEDRPRYDARATALKWTLVTTFGYQGFHNAKFGLIEAHEAITAWGRESLLIAKEVFERAGYQLLHALTDSLYVLKPGHTDVEISALCREVQSRTGLTLGIEGVYDWISFLPSKTHSTLSVATRYFGRFANGDLKVRGIKVRQHSTPPFLREAQEGFLAIMQECRSRAELEAAAPRLRAACTERVRLLWSGKAAPHTLAITAQVSQDVRQYRSNSPVAVVLRILAARGISVSAGQTVRYVIVDQKNVDPLQRYLPEPFLDQVRDYDARAYELMLRDAYDEVAVHFKSARTVMHSQTTFDD